jgi:(E)-4-hydroxy-3-methylbut-2-enyl-diphosphate synthase
VFVDGRLMTTLRGDKIAEEFIAILDEYVETHYSKKEAQTAVST